MSKRGSNSAKFIGGKDWKNGRADNDLNKILKLLRANNRHKLLDTKFKDALSSFGIKCHDYNFNRVKDQILREKNKNIQALFFENIEPFKDFASKKNIEFTIENYFDKKYYLKDFSGILESEFGFSNFSIEKLKELNLNINRIKTNTSLRRYMIRAHIEYLIFQKTESNF